MTQMAQRKRSLALSFLATLAVGFRPALAQPIPLGPEVPVDEVRFYFPEPPLIAAGAEGGFALAWAPYNLTLARAAGADGVLGAVHLLATIPPGFHSSRLVALTATGDGYSMLRERWRTAPGRERVDHLLQPLDSDAAPTGTARLLRRGPVALTPLPVGGYVALWEGGVALNVQVLGASGEAIAPVRRLAVGSHHSGKVVAGAGEGFTVVWRSLGLRDGEWIERGLHGRRCDARGQPVGRSFLLVPPPPAEKSYALTLTAAAPDGTLAAASSLFGADTAASGEVTLRTFDRDGHPLGPAVAITTAEEALTEESFPQSVSFAADGRLLLLWAQYASPYEPSSRGGVFDRRGAPLGGPFTLASAASADHPGILWANGARAGAAWVVTWIGSTVPPDEEDTTMQLYVRRFADD